MYTHVCVYIHIHTYIYMHLCPRGAEGRGFRGTKGVPRSGGLNIGRHEGLSMYIIESRTQSNQLLPATPTPWDPP